MNTVLWVLQALFGIVFVLHGVLLIAQPASRRDTLANLPYSRRFLHFIGVLEVLGGLGLVLPWLLGIAPLLTPLAALGLAVITLGAASSHLRVREARSGFATSLIAVLMVVVVIGRW